MTSNQQRNTDASQPLFTAILRSRAVGSEKEIRQEAELRREHRASDLPRGVNRRFEGTLNYPGRLRASSTLPRRARSPSSITVQVFQTYTDFLHNRRNPDWRPSSTRRAGRVLHKV